MNEEIDIIELLKRVKEGKAPKKIEIDNAYYEFNEHYETIEEMYDEIEFDVLWHIDAMNFDTKIKILDKPQNQIIEELDDKDINWLVKSSENEHIPERERTIINCMVELYNAVEEIIDNINKGGKIK